MLRLLFALCLFPQCLAFSVEPTSVLAGTTTTLRVFTTARCKGAEQVACPHVATDGLAALCGNTTLCSLVVGEHLWPQGGTLVNRPFGRPIQQCLGTEIGRLRAAQCNYQLFVNATTPVGSFVEFKLNGVVVGKPLAVEVDPRAHVVTWTIPDGALRYSSTGVGGQTALVADIAGPTVREILAHFTTNNLPGYLCCNPEVAATDGVKLRSSLVNTTVLTFDAPLDVNGTTFFGIDRVTNHTIGNVTVQISAALNNTQTKTNPGLVPAACLMAKIFPTGDFGPHAFCPYTADMSAWTPTSLAANPVTEITVQLRVMRDGPPSNTSSAQFATWQNEDLNMYEHIVNVLPWTTPAAGYGRTAIGPHTHVCAQTGCAITITTHTPAPRFTQQAPGGDDGFQMLGRFTIGTTVLALQTANVSRTPSNTSLAGHPDPLYTFWYATFTFTLPNLTPITTVSGFSGTGKAEFFGTFWDYDKGLAQGWSEPVVDTASPSLQFETALSFYDPVVFNPSVSASVTSPANTPDTINFIVSVVRGLRSVSLPVTPVLFPLVRFKRQGHPTAEFVLDATEVQYATLSFQTDGLYRGTINLATLTSARFTEVLRVGATYDVTLLPPYFEGANTPGGAWQPASVFPTPLSVTLPVTPQYPPVTIACHLPGPNDGGAFSHALAANLLCTITLRTAEVTLVDRFDVNGTTSAGSTTALSRSLANDCTTTSVSATFNQTMCTLSFSHTFSDTTTSFTPLVFTRNTTTGVVTPHATTTYPLRAIPNMANAAVTIKPSVVVLPAIDILLAPFVLTTPVAVEDTARPTVSPNITVSFLFLPTGNTAQLTFAAGKPTAVPGEFGMYQVTIEAPLQYANLNASTTVELTVTTPWWAEDRWLFPEQRPTNWPVLKPVVLVRHEAEVASLSVPTTTPVPGTVPAGTLKVEDGYVASTVLFTLGTGIVAVGMLLIVGLQ
jgi:hypothetical protein